MKDCVMLKNNKHSLYFLHLFYITNQRHWMNKSRNYVNYEIKLYLDLPGLCYFAVILSKYGFENILHVRFV